MSKIIYIGRFTPTSGGVTAKNTAIFNEISKVLPIEKMDLTELKKGKVSMLFSLIAALFKSTNTLVLGTTAKARRFISMLLYYFNKKAMNRSVLVVMGGSYGKVIAEDFKYRKWISQYKAVFVETEIMKKQLEDVGLNNVSVFPNCRKKPEREITIKERNGRLKCVCFSLIYPEKGINLVLEAAEQLPETEFHFWGRVFDEYKSEFFSKVDRLPNCTYNGIFDITENDVYEMLNGYDLFLFPTLHVGEGVPGALIEAKIAGVPAISSGLSYNNELVEDGVNGIVLKENNAEYLAEAIKKIDADSDLLYSMKEKAKQSGEKFYFEEYIDNLVEMLN